MSIERSFDFYPVLLFIHCRRDIFTQLLEELAQWEPSIRKHPPFGFVVPLVTRIFIA
jgi:hypothetical protein